MKYALWLLLGLPMFVQAKPTDPATTAFPDSYYTSVDWTKFEQWAAVNQKIDLRNVDYNLLQAAIFFYTNQYRAGKKLPALQYRPALGNAATYQTKQMGDKGFYDHVNPYDRTMRTALDRSEKFGFDGEVVGENLALEFLLNYKAQTSYWYEASNSGYRYYYGDSRNNKGYVPQHTYLSLGKSVVQAWINSPGHRANLVNKSYRYLGVGVYLDPKTQGNSSIPKVFAAQVFGG